MEYRQLHYFLAIAEEMSFTEAATRLQIAQPALSVQMRHLEDELGVKLIDRSRRTIALTEAGRAMVTEARKLLGSRDNTVELIRKIGSGAIGSLSMGFVSGAANVALPPLLRSFTSGHPEVALTFRELPPDSLLAALHTKEIDICFIYLPFKDPSLTQRVVSREEFVVALPDTHRLASSARVAIGDLRDEPFVMPARYRIPGLRAQILDICRDAGFEPHVAQDNIWLHQTMIGVVAAGNCVALMPENIQVLSPPGVVYRRLSGAKSHPLELAAVWRRTDQSPVLQAFVSTLPTEASQRPSVAPEQPPRSKRDSATTPHLTRSGGRRTARERA